MKLLPRVPLIVTPGSNAGLTYRFTPGLSIGSIAIQSHGGEPRLTWLPQLTPTNAFVPKVTPPKWLINRYGE